MSLVGFIVRGGNSGGLKIVHITPDVEDQVAIGTANGVADGSASKRTDDLVLEVAAGVVASEQQDHTARQDTETISSTEVLLDIVEPALADFRVRSGAAKVAGIGIDELIGKDKHAGADQLQIAQAQEPPNDSTSAALDDGIGGYQGVSKFILHVGTLSCNYMTFDQTNQRD